MEQEEMMDRTADAEEIERVKELTECIVKSIKKIMIDRGVDRKQLARMVGVSQSLLSSVFNCKRRFKMELLTKIADVLGCSVTVGFKKKIVQRKRS